MTKSDQDNQRLSQTYAGLNPVSMALSPIVNDLLPADKKLLGNLLTEWKTITRGLPSANARPVKFTFGHKSNRATLTLATPGARALEVEYCTPQTLERINRFLGRKVVERIKIRQSNDIMPADPSPAQDNTPAPEEKGASKRKSLNLSSVHSEQLQERLEKLYATLNSKIN